MLSAPLVKAIPEDIRYGQLLRAGIDDDEALRILDGRQDTPEMDLPDDISERYLAPIILKKTRHLCPLCVSTMSCQTSQRYMIQRSYAEIWIFSKSKQRSFNAKILRLTFLGFQNRSGISTCTVRIDTVRASRGSTD